MLLVKRYAKPALLFARKFTPGDVALLIVMDRANEDVCGVAIRAPAASSIYRLCDQRYERLPYVKGLSNQVGA